MSYIQVNECSKYFQVGDSRVIANNKISFTINKGEFVVIVGPSGAGKSTMLNLLGGMDVVSDGEIRIDGQDIASYDKKQLTKYRRFDVGFVFQFYNLIPNLTTLENVELAAEIAKDALPVPSVLKQVGLSHRLHSFPSQLSGGEQQRVAIARALAKNPKLLLCDEPTGALDYQTGKTILKLLHDTSRKTGKTIVVITHNQAIAPMADRVITINNAQVRNIQKNEHPVAIEELEW